LVLLKGGTGMTTVDISQPTLQEDELAEEMRTSGPVSPNGWPCGELDGEGVLPGFKLKIRAL
jgi:hypothetical protein